MTNNENRILRAGAKTGSWKNCILLTFLSFFCFTGCITLIPSEDDTDTIVHVGQDSETEADAIDTIEEESDTDECPNDDNKTEPGVCGCGKAEDDKDGDGTPDCIDPCPDEPHETECSTECGDDVCDAEEDCSDCAADCGDCPSEQLELPLRGAFYYPWFPQTWKVGGEHVFYNPDLGYYSSDDQKVVDKHIDFMDYGKIEVAISSWWGIGKYTDTRFSLLLNRTKELGSSLKWAIYYEKEGFDAHDTSVSALKADLEYLKKYTGHEAFARMAGKPVIFVYNANDNTCDVANRWSQANSNGEWYVVLKVFPGYRDCSNQPDSWHQYGPGVPTSKHTGYAYGIAPGFWRADQSSPLLARDVDRWYQNVRDMVASGEPWQLIVSFNEWGEGTAVEPAKEWKSDSGYGVYLDALHSDGKR